MSKRVVFCVFPPSYAFCCPLYISCAPQCIVFKIFNIFSLHIYQKRKMSQNMQALMMDIKMLIVKSYERNGGLIQLTFRKQNQQLNLALIRYINEGRSVHWTFLKAIRDERIIFQAKGCYRKLNWLWELSLFLVIFKIRMALFLCFQGLWFIFKQ